MSAIACAVTCSLRMAKRDASSIPTRPTARRSVRLDCEGAGCAGASVFGTGAGAGACATVNGSAPVVKGSTVVMETSLLFEVDRKSNYLLSSHIDNGEQRNYCVRCASA